MLIGYDNIISRKVDTNARNIIYWQANIVLGRIAGLVSNIHTSMVMNMLHQIIAR